MLGRCRRYWMLQLGMRGPVGEMALHHTADHLFGERNVNDPALGDRVEAIRPPLDGLGRDVVADEITVQCRADSGEPADSPLHNAGMLSPQVVDEARKAVRVTSSDSKSIWHGRQNITAMPVIGNFKYNGNFCQEVILA